MPAADPRTPPPSTTATIDEIALADEPARWEGLGFIVTAGRCQLGAVVLRLLGEQAGRGIVGWSLRGIGSTELDGLPTSRSRSPVPVPAPAHPNGVAAIDHVVALSPDLDRTIAALGAAGLQLRRVREGPSATGAPRQAFFRLGREILEVVPAPPDGGPRARFWGLALRVEDLQVAAEALGESLGSVRPAVQAGRSIATVRRSAGLSVPLALISASAQPAG